MSIEVRRFIWDYLDSNMYIIPVKDQALVIDPVDSSEAFDFLRSFQEIYVLLTHEHFDHISGLNRIRIEHKCTVIAQEKCSARIQDSKNNLSATADVMLELSGRGITTKNIKPFVCESADLTFVDSLMLKWTDYWININSLPGHSPGSVCITLDKLLFTGDSLLRDGPMNRFPGGSERMYRKRTIPYLHKILQGNMTVYPGHGSSFSSEEIDWVWKEPYLF